MAKEGWICFNCGNRTYALPYADNETLYRCPFCRHHFRKKQDGSLIPVEKS